MELIDGKKIAAQVKQELADEVKRMKAAGAKTPHLVAVLVTIRRVKLMWPVK